MKKLIMLSLAVLMFSGCENIFTGKSNMDGYWKLEYESHVKIIIQDGEVITFLWADYFISDQKKTGNTIVLEAVWSNSSNTGWIFADLVMINDSIMEVDLTEYEDGDSSDEFWIFKKLIAPQI